MSKSEEAGCVEEKDRRGARIGRERAGARLRRAGEEPLSIMAVMATVTVVAMCWLMIAISMLRAV